MIDGDGTAFRERRAQDLLHDFTSQESVYLIVRETEVLGACIGTTEAAAQAAAVAVALRAVVARLPIVFDGRDGQGRDDH